MILILLQIEIQHLLMRSMERTLMDPKGRTEPGYRMHAFICGHSRPEGSVRGCCTDKNSLDLMRQFKISTREKGILDVRVQKSGCLDFCEAGPTCVIYPSGDWFQITDCLLYTSDAADE